MKTSPLLRRTRLRARPRRVDKGGPARVAWKVQRAGWCQCGCDRWSLHLEHHHIVTAEVIRRERREDMLWDPRNGMYLTPLCHGRHTSAQRRIPLASVPDAAVAFAVDLLGEDLAVLYLARYYSQKVAA